MVIMPVIMLHRRELYRTIIRGIDKPNLALTTSSVFGLILGLILVDVHNIWVWKPQVVVTIVSWLILLKSILWLSMPEKMIGYCKKMSKSSWFYVQLVVTALLGIFLLAKGFFLFTPAYFPFNG